MQCHRTVLSKCSHEGFSSIVTECNALSSLFASHSSMLGAWLTRRLLRRRVEG